MKIHHFLVVLFLLVSVSLAMAEPSTTEPVSPSQDPVTAENGTVGNGTSPPPPKVTGENTTDRAGRVEAETLIRDLERARRTFLREIKKSLEADRKTEVVRNESSLRSSKEEPVKRKERPRKQTEEPAKTPAKAPSRPEGSTRTLASGKRPTDIPDYIHVWPEDKTFVPISRIDVNRFVCAHGQVRGHFFSRDKGIVTHKAGKNLFLRIVPDSYAFKHPFELYVVCGTPKEEETYFMILTGEDISSRTVVLQHSAKSTREVRSSSPRVARIVELVKQAFSESFSPGFTITRTLDVIPPKTFGLPKGMKIFRYLEVDTGDWVCELYFLSSSLNAPYRLKEENFVLDDTVAVSALTPVVPANGFGRLLIIREKIKSIFGGGR